MPTLPLLLSKDEIPTPRNETAGGESQQREKQRVLITIIQEQLSLPATWLCAWQYAGRFTWVLE